MTKKQNDKNDGANTPKKEKHSVVDGIKENALFFIITTLFALGGGTKAILDIYHSFTKKPGFVFNYGNLAMSQLHDAHQPKQKTLFIFTGVIYNDGELPLFPKYFYLKIKSGQDLVPNDPQIIWDSFPPIPIPNTPLELVYSDASDKDLRRVSKIEPNDAAYGHLMFVSELPLDYFLNDTTIEYQIVCLDILKRKYYAEDRRWMQPEPGYDPKWGIQIRPIEKGRTYNIDSIIDKIPDRY